jgi:urea-proton symporter
MLSGNLIAIISSAVIHYVYSVFVDPQDYDFAELDTHIRLVEADLRGLTKETLDPKLLQHAERWITRRGYALTLILIVVWPLCSIPAGVFSKSYFAFWVLLSMAWGFGGALTTFILPLVESSEEINTMLSGIFHYFTGIEARRAQDPNEVVAEPEVVVEAKDVGVDKKAAGDSDGSEQEA